MSSLCDAKKSIENCKWVARWTTLDQRPAITGNPGIAKFIEYNNLNSSSGRLFPLYSAEAW